MMLTHYHGNLFNASELGRAFGASDVTIKKYLDILTGTFMIRQLQPWHENVLKRQVKAPKIYFRDSGIFHSLLGVDGMSNLRIHPKIGASWEGFALEEVVRLYQASSADCYFWSTYSGAEIDLLIIQKNKKIGFEFKFSDAPSITKSMQIALIDLKLDELNVIYPGDVNYALSEKIQVKSLKSFFIQNKLKIDL
jgi:predicted AAA+ superfamily ATPase